MNDESEKSNKSSNAHDLPPLDSKRTWIILIFILVFIAIMVGIASNQVKSTPKNQTVENFAATEVERYKSIHKLPQKVCNFATLMEIFAKGNTIHYKYNVEGTDTTKLSDTSLYDSLKPGVCSDANSLKLLNAGVVKEFTYYVLETKKQFTADITISDCN